LEIDMDSALRPRDIQARIRAGETPEAVAVLAGVPVDKILPYCLPVLAERQHIAVLAGRSRVRRKNTDSQARSLNDVVAERLRGRGVDPESVEWDAWRRDDGRWAVQASYHSGERERTATFAFDAIGRFSLADDDEAKWLTGEQQSSSKGPQPREGARSNERRLSAVPSGDDLLTLSEDTGHELTDEELSDDLTAVVRAVSEDGAVLRVQTPEHAPTPAGGRKAGGEADADEASPDGPDASSPSSSRGAPDADSATVAPDHAEQVGVSATPRERVPERRRKSGRRASVPSWDEIMLGRSKDQ